MTASALLPPPVLPSANPGPLTAGELEVLCLVSLGCSNPEIAHAMHLSPHVVKAHLTRVFAKLGAPNRVGLVGEGFRLGLLRPRRLHPAVVVPLLAPHLAELLPLIAAGLTVEEMAGRVFRSPDAVKSRLARLLRLLGASGRDEAVRRAIEAGYLVLGLDGSWGAECDPRRHGGVS